MKTDSDPIKGNAKPNELDFEHGVEDGRPCYRANPAVLECMWENNPSGEVRIHYKGRKGILFVPLPGIFEPGDDGLDQVFRLNDKEDLVLKLRPKNLVGELYSVKGDFSFPYALFDENMNTFAIGNSPPRMKVGP